MSPNPYWIHPCTTTYAPEVTIEKVTDVKVVKSMFHFYSERIK